MEQKNTNDDANIHTTADNDIAIAYQNKDIVSKLFGDQMKGKSLSMMVLYTADIEKTKTVFSRTACQIQVEASYMTGLPSEEWLAEVRKGIADHVVTDEILMHLVLLPLTYKGEEKKQEAVRACLDLARQESQQKTAKNMLKRGNTPEEIAEILELPIETIKAWEKEFYAIV